MNFTHYSLGHLERGSVVEVTLYGNAANVQLMDGSNLQNYRNGRRYQFYGGLMTRSPARIAVPRSGTWHLAIDVRGLRNGTRSSVKVIPASALRPLPALREPPLASMPSLVRDLADAPPAVDGDDRTYDVFISHASEDKDAIVRPLAAALKAAGLEVWYDEYELRIGDSLRRKIDKGLAHSRFGIVVLSKAFFGRGWPEYELDGLVTRANSGEQVLLPVWHNVTKAEVMGYSPSLADKLARSTATSTVEEIAAEIAAVIADARAPA